VTEAVNLQGKVLALKNSLQTLVEFTKSDGPNAAVQKPKGGIKSHLGLGTKLETTQLSAKQRKKKDEASI